MDDRQLIDQKAIVRLGYGKISLALAGHIESTDVAGFYHCADLTYLSGRGLLEFDIEAENVVFISDKLYNALLKEVCKLHKYQDLVRESLVAAYRANSGTPAYIVRQSKMNEKTNSL